MNNYLHLPSLRGIIGDWTFFCSVMKVKDVVNRVITVSQSNELYTNNINEILQREIDKKRVDQIRDYLLNNPEHFFSSIIVAIYGGTPVWSDFDIESHFRVENTYIGSKASEFIENKLGVLSLSGEETIFALDGQHRIRGIKEAFEKNDTIGDEEVSLIFVVHNQNQKERTRRLFTVLNKYAQKPKEAELIILDEDDSAAIITRRLLDQHSVLRHPNAISSSNTSNIPVRDTLSFSTLVTINRVNKEILKHARIDYSKRPKENSLLGYLNECVDYWNFFFETFPEIEKTLNGHKCYFSNGDLFNRNKHTGGSLMLRPIGQLLFAELYTIYRDAGKLKEFSKKAKSLDLNLNGSLCKYITWNNKMIPKTLSLQKSIFKYILGLSSNDSIHEDIKKQLAVYGIEYNERFKQL